MPSSRYRQDELLYADDSSSIFRGWDHHLQRAVTLKVLARTHGFDRSRARLEREARILGGLMHPALVPVYEVDLQSDPPLMVLGPIRGQSLRSLVDTGGASPWGRVQIWTQAVLQCLSLAHARGFVHHDLSPDVVFVEPETSSTQLLGFGRTKLIGRDASTLQERAVPPIYWAPELFLSDELDPRSDIYGVAALAYYACTGVPPIAVDPRKGMGVALSQIMHTDPKPPSALGPHLPAEFDEVLLRALAKDPAQRYQSADEMLVALAELGGATLPIEPHPKGEPIAVGEMIDGRYRIKGRLGSGGMSTVFLAEDVQTPRNVALKSLHSTLEAGYEDLMNEAAGLQAITHENIIDVFGVGSYRGQPYLALEHVPGHTVFEEMRKQRGALPKWLALSILDQVARGLEAVHAGGLIHGDVKPGNVVLGPGLRACVCDFGLVRTSAAVVGEDSRFRGTPAYIAPERIDGDVRPDLARRMDVYALGIMAYEMLTGRRPFREPTVERLLDAHMWTTVDPPSSRSPSLKWADAPILAALDKDPISRTATCTALSRALVDEALESELERSGRVLLIEDDLDFVDFVVAAQEHFLPSIELVHVPDGTTGCAMMETQTFDAVLMDLDLPGQNGFEIAAHVRATLRDPPPIACVTGHGKKADWQLLAAMGVGGFIRKPLRPEDLIAMMLRTLESGEKLQ